MSASIPITPTRAMATEPSELDGTLLSPTASSVVHPCTERLFSEEQDLARRAAGAQRQLSSGSIKELREGVGACALQDKIDPESESEDTFEDAREEPGTPMKNNSEPLEDSSAQSQSWKERRKHLFLLSEAGKPIYSLYGDEDELASLMAVMQAMVSYVADMGDTLKAFNLGEGRRMVFLTRPPLILVAVSRGGESVTQLSSQLDYLYNQVLSLLTLTSVKKVFAQRQGFDLRRMLAGSERLLASLSVAMDTDPSFFLNAVPVMSMPSSARDPISANMLSAFSKGKNVVFAILMADNQLVTMVRMKKYTLYASDLHLIFNLVNSTESFKYSEAWTPICLPKFDSSGFMQAHVSYLSEDSPVCLVMLTVDRDIFFEISEVKKKLVASFEKTNSLTAITEALKKSRQTPTQLGFHDIRNFIYKAKAPGQFTCSALSQPYLVEEHARRLHEMYLRLQNRLDSQFQPVKLIYHEGRHENVMGWTTQSFELYATFAPTVTKNTAIHAVNKLLKWVKKEESSLFILNGPTY